MTQYWLITKKSDASTIEASFATKDAKTHPKDAGFAWDAALHVATPLPGPFDPAAQMRQGLGYVEDPAKAQIALLAAVKAEAERRKMLVLSLGGAKKTEYADKSAEVRMFNSLAGTLNAILAALTLMTAERRAIIFPYATADAAAFGDTIDKAIARFSTGMSTSATVPTIAAAEAKACAAIKAATTVAAKRAAAAAVTWP